MKRCTFLVLLIALVLPAAAAAQDAAKPAEAKSQKLTVRKTPTKATTISGQVSLDGKTLVSDEDDIWVISNPDVLAGHAGQQVVVKCQLLPDKNEIHVFSVRTGLREVKYVAKSGDSAFRR